MSSRNNIWNKEDFRMCGLGEKCKLLAKIRHIKNCICWSWQRIVRGYGDCDKWNMSGYIQNLIPEMLQDMRDNRWGSPSYLGQNYTNADGVLVNDTCHEEWNKILDQMIHLWREANEETCGRKNPYEDEYYRAHDDFEEKYGLLGEKLQTEAELEENRKRGGGGTIHFMTELPEYKDIWDRYFEEEQKLDKYRNECRDEALDLLKKHFNALWD